MKEVISSYKITKYTMINIGGSSDDPTYRYKMPKLLTKIEGRGNGIKTVILNVDEVAKHLHVSPKYITKFFGMELGAISKFDSDRVIITGMHHDLQALLTKFVNLFVLCPKCTLPETKMKGIKVECNACGYSGELKTSHKLKSYILKCSPVTGRKKQPKTVTLKKENTKIIKQVANSEAISLTFMKDWEIHKVISELRHMELLQRWTSTDKAFYFLCAFFRNDEEKVQIIINNNAPLFVSISENCGGQRNFWAAFEKYFIYQKPELIEDLPIIMHKLYEIDVLDEDFCMSWHASSFEESWLISEDNAKLLRSKASPFIKWLNDAEEED